jgi:prepilin-type processing-associated H-X9-DG protein
MNTYLSSETEPTQPISRIERPAATIFMSEKNDDVACSTPKEIRAYFGSGNIKEDPKNSAHFLFCDGHVTLVKREVFDPKNDSDSEEDPSPTNVTHLNRNFTFIPYPNAIP